MITPQSKICISIIEKPSTIIFKGCIQFYLKKYARKLFRIQRGPDVVLKSLIRGLQTIKHKSNHGVSYNINPIKRQLCKTVHVLSNPIALEWAIQQKALGHIDNIIAGPNISILPSFDNKVLNNPLIDIILLPSEWVKELYILDTPSIEHKIKIWPSGVAIPEMDRIAKPQSEKDFYLVFKKTFGDIEYSKIIEVLASKNIAFKTLVYGTFKQNEYFELLQHAKGMIYLQKSESQGIALQEAWARNVPTLVWNQKTYTYEGTGITITGSIGAPYLTEQSGIFFESIEEFENKFIEFQSRIDTFTAREYCIQNLSDAASANLYIEYISQIL